MTAALQVEQRGPVAWVWMNRPQTHNAFDDRLVAELDATLARLEAQPEVRVLVLAGRGRSFSAGADLNWMRAQGEAGTQANLEDARQMGAMFLRLDQLSKPSVARVHGAAIGGGLGLAAACTICIASESASFATSEVRLGLAPAVISPYVLRAIGARQAQRYFLTAERFNARRAQEIGLVHECVADDELDARLERIVEDLLAGDAQAQQASRKLIRQVAGRAPSPALLEETADCIARLRAAPQARERLSAFLERSARKSP